MVLNGGITQNVTAYDPGHHLSSLNYTVNNALFVEAIRNLNWSRGYLWYVELDDVPSPFQRNGVIGLPVTDITYVINSGETFSWESSMEQFAVPKSKKLCTINMTVLDDEQETLFTFFERWYNNIYNCNIGVLPLTEACKCISIYKLKSTRSRVTRSVRSYDAKKANEDPLSAKTVWCRDFLVYPEGFLQEQMSYGESGPRQFNIELVVAAQLNSDYGNPSEQSDTSIFSNVQNETVGNFLSKIADYI